MNGRMDAARLIGWMHVARLIGRMAPGLIGWIDAARLIAWMVNRDRHGWTVDPRVRVRAEAVVDGPYEVVFVHQPHLARVPIVLHKNLSVIDGALQRGNEVVPGVGVGARAAVCEQLLHRTPADARNSSRKLQSASPQPPFRTELPHQLRHSRKARQPPRTMHGP